DVEFSLLYRGATQPQADEDAVLAAEPPANQPAAFQQADFREDRLKCFRILGPEGVNRPPEGLGISGEPADGLTGGAQLGNPVVRSTSLRHGQTSTNEISNQ